MTLVDPGIDPGIDPGVDPGAHADGRQASAASFVEAAFQSAVDRFVDYCARDRERIERRVVHPALGYLAARFAWGIRVFQAVAVLVFVQTLLLLCLLAWLLWREAAARPGLAATVVAR